MHPGRAPLLAFLLGATLALPLQIKAQTAKLAEPHALKKADADFRDGLEAQRDGNLAMARSKFAAVVRLAPTIAEGHEALGAVLLELGKPADAIPELETAQKIKPGDDGIEANLALAYLETGETTKAIVHFDAALQLSKKPGQAPLTAPVYDAYGRALSASGKPVEAIRQFTAEESLFGRRPDLDDAIGSIYAQQGQWNEARTRFNDALRTDPNFVPARVHLGVLFRQQKDLNASLASLEVAAKINPPNPEALAEYGRSLAAAGKDEDAVEQFNQALKLNPAQPGAQLDEAMALQRLGRQQEAIPLFQQVIAHEPHNSSALTNLGLALTLTGKAKEALDLFQRSLAENAKDAVLYKDLGVAHVQLSAFDEAISDFQKALALDPNDPQSHYDLGLAYKFKDRLNDAIAELTRAGQMDPALQDPPYTLGILLMQVGKLDDAIVELRKAVALRPENGDAWAILGSTLKQDSRLPEAAEALRKAIPLLPGQPGPRVTLAGVLAEQAAALADQANAAEAAGDTKKAGALRSQMTGLRSQAADLRREGAELARGAVSRQRANFAMNAGNQLMLRGQIADAVARYQESIAADPTFAEPHSQLAIAYERQGRADEAAAERAKAAALATTKEATASPQ